MLPLDFALSLSLTHTTSRGVRALHAAAQSERRELALCSGPESMAAGSELMAGSELITQDSTTFLSQHASELSLECSAKIGHVTKQDKQ